MVEDIIEKGADLIGKGIDSKVKANEVNKDLAEIEEKSVVSARQREIDINAIQDSSWLSRNVSSILALIVGTAGLASWFLVKLDGEARAYINSALMLVLSYYFGSTTSKFRTNAIGHERVKNSHELALKKEEEKTKREEIKTAERLERLKVQEERRRNRKGLFNFKKKEE